MPVPMNALGTDGPSGAFGGPWASARAEGGCTMADQDCEATHLVVRAPSRSRLEPGHIGRTGAGSPGPAGAWDWVGPVVRHEALPAAYASMVAASTLADPARAARSFWRLHGAWGNRSVQRVVASARGIEADGDRMRHVERAIEDGRSGGQALDSGVQAPMGRPLAADFRGVRVHADAHPNRLNRSRKRPTFTQARTVGFNGSASAPERAKAAAPAPVFTPAAIPARAGGRERSRTGVCATKTRNCRRPSRCCTTSSWPR